MMDKTLVQQWLDRYLVAWRSNDPADIRALFTDDAIYRGIPLDPDPWQGIEAIVGGWLRYQDETDDWTFSGAPLAWGDGVAVIEGRTDYVGGSTAGRTWSNLWVVRFAEDGRAREFTEWAIEPGPARSSGEAEG